MIMSELFSLKLINAYKIPPLTIMLLCLCVGKVNAFFRFKKYENKTAHFSSLPSNLNGHRIVDFKSKIYASLSLRRDWRFY